MRVVTPPRTSPTGHCPARGCTATDRPGHLGWGTFAPGVPCPACGHDRERTQLTYLVSAPDAGMAQWPTDVRHAHLDDTGTVTVMVDRDVTDTFDVRSEDGRAELTRAGLDPDHVLTVLTATATRTRSTA